MESFLPLFAQYGLIALFVSIFLEQLGMPVPALPFIFLAGAAAAENGDFGVRALLTATLAAMLANSLWFIAGKRYGRQVLTLLCRISISPDRCVRQSELSFVKRGVFTLIIAKFVPGLSILVAPLAGALGMSALSFTVLNFVGTFLWVGSGIAGGVIFHNQIEHLFEYVGELGSVTFVIALGLLGLYIGWRVWRRWRVSIDMAGLSRVNPDDLAKIIAQGGRFAILDVRSVLYGFFPKGRIPGASHIDLASIEAESMDDWPKETQIITYCCCPNDASALKAAHILAKRGRNVSVLKGGYTAWVESGYSIEPFNAKTIAWQ